VHDAVRHLKADVAPEGAHLVGRSLSETVAAIRSLSIRDPVTGCLLFQGHLNHKGYGRISYNGRYPTVHRVMYVAKHGPIPSTVHVLHRCDRPNCGEESHLFPGDNTINQRDRRMKGRGSKLNPEKVFKIKGLLSAGNSQQEIAKLFGVTPSVINRINNGKRWGFLSQVVESRVLLRR